MQDVDEPLILPPFKFVVWNSVSDCQTREGRGNRNQKKRPGAEHVKLYPDHDDPSDEAFLARHHKLEREEKLAHYYMRTMQNKDGPDKHDRRVEQTIKSLRPPPILEGPMNERPHAPCRLQCTCCPCRMCSQLGVEPHKSLAELLEKVPMPDALHLLKVNTPQYLSYAERQAIEGSPWPEALSLSSTAEESAVPQANLQRNRAKPVAVLPLEQRIRQTVCETHVANAADSKDMQCAIVDQPRFLSSSPETAAGYLPPPTSSESPDCLPTSTATSSLPPAITYRRPIWQPVLVTARSCPTSEATRPLQPVMWKWDRGLELPRPFVGSRAFRCAHPPSTKRRYKLQRSGACSALSRRALRQWDTSSGAVQDAPMLTWPDIVGCVHSESPASSIKEEATEEANVAAKLMEHCREDTLKVEATVGCAGKGPEWGRRSRLSTTAAAGTVQKEVPTLGQKGKRRQPYSLFGCKRRKADPTAPTVRPDGAGWVGPSLWTAYHITVKKETDEAAGRRSGSKLRLQLARRMVPRHQRTEGLEEELGAALHHQAAETRRVLQTVTNNFDILVVPRATDFFDPFAPRHPVFGDLQAMQQQFGFLWHDPALRRYLHPLLGATPEWSEEVEEACFPDDHTMPGLRRGTDRQPSQLHAVGTRMVRANRCNGVGSATDDAFEEHSSPWRSAATNTTDGLWPSSNRFRISTGTSTQASSTTQTPRLLPQHMPLGLDCDDEFFSALCDMPELAAPSAFSLGPALPSSPALPRSDFCGDTDDMPSPFIAREDVDLHDFCGDTQDISPWPASHVASSATNTEPLGFADAADCAEGHAASALLGYQNDLCDALTGLHSSAGKADLDSSNEGFPW